VCVRIDNADVDTDQRRHPRSLVPVQGHGRQHLRQPRRLTAHDRIYSLERYLSDGNNNAAMTVVASD